MTENNFLRLGVWMRKRAQDTFRRLHDASHVLLELDIARGELAQEWNAQIAYQMRALPSKYAFSSLEQYSKVY